MKDFYAILGVSKASTQAEVKTAYVRLSKALHPDVNENGAALMQQVNEAYEVLGDVKKRAAYDRGQNVREFVKDGASFTPGVVPGTVDLTKLVQAFVAASVEQLLESFGLLKKKKGRKKSFGLLKKKKGRKSA